MIKVAALLVMSFVIASDSLAMLPTEAQSNKARKSRVDALAIPLPRQLEYNSPIRKKRVILSDISKQPPPFQAAVTTPPRKKILQFPKADDLELPNDMMPSVDSPVGKVPLKIVHEKISMDEIFEQAVHSLKYEKFKNNISDSQRQVLHDEVARTYELETKQKLAYNELSEDALRLKTLIEAFITKPQIARQRFMSSGNISEEDDVLSNIVPVEGSVLLGKNSLSPPLDSAPSASSRKVLSSEAKSIQRPTVSVVGSKVPQPIITGHTIITPRVTYPRLMEPSKLRPLVLDEIVNANILVPQTKKAQNILPSAIRNVVGNQEMPSGQIKFAKDVAPIQLLEPSLIDPVVDLATDVIGKPRVSEVHLKAPTTIQAPIFYAKDDVIKAPHVEVAHAKSASEILPIHVELNSQPISVSNRKAYELMKAAAIQEDVSINGVTNKIIAPKVPEVKYLAPSPIKGLIADGVTSQKLVYSKASRIRMLNHVAIIDPVVDLATDVIKRLKTKEKLKFPASIRDVIFHSSAAAIGHPIIDGAEIKQVSRVLGEHLVLPASQIVKPRIDEVEVVRPSVIREIDQNILVRPISFSGARSELQVIKSVEIQKPIISVSSDVIKGPIVEGARRQQSVAITPPNIEPSAKQITVPDRVVVEVIESPNIQPTIMDREVIGQPISFSGEARVIEAINSVEIQKHVINTKSEVIKTPEVQNYLPKEPVSILAPDVPYVVQPIAKPNVTTIKLMTAAPIQEVVIIPEEAGKQPIQFAGTVGQLQLLQPSVVQALIEPAPIKKDVAMAHNHIPTQTISIQRSVEEDSEQTSSDSTEGLAPPTVGQHMDESFSPMNILLATQNNGNLTIQKYKELIVDQSIKMVLSEVDVFMLPLEARLDSSELRVGAAAGDEKLNKNLWFKSFASVSKRNINIDNLILNKKHTGFIVGVDTDLTDNLLCGLAYMRSSSKTKLSNIRDNTQDTHLQMAAFYTECAVNSKVKLHSYLKYGWSDIKLKDSQNIDIDSIKFNILRARSSYNITQNYPAGVTLISKIGCSIDQFKIYPMSNIPYKQGDKLTLNLSLALKKKFVFKDYQIIPEFGFGMDYMLAENNPEFLFSSLFKSKSSSSISHLFSSDKMVYNTGILLCILNHDKYELSFGYNMSVAKNLMRHFGSLSVIIKL
jgi:hypothetical protein